MINKNELKKITKILGIIFAVLIAFSLYLPVYKTTFTDGESMTLLLRGFDLYEFSAWGVLAMLVPLLLIGIMFTKFNDKSKSAMIMGTFILGNISVHEARIAMREWLYGEATGMVHPYGGLIFYVAFLLCASILCYVHCTQNTTLPASPSIHDFREYLEKENKTFDNSYLFEREYLLFNKPCKIIKNEKKVLCEEYDAHVLFATPDGYFMADAHDDHRNIEFEIDGNVSGFATKNTPEGLVGIFYEDVDLTSFERIKIIPESEISTGDAELKHGSNKARIDITLDDGKIFGTFCDEDIEGQNVVGAVVVQNGKLAAIVTVYDEKRKLLVCESAERYAKELYKTAYEYELFGVTAGFRDFCKDKNIMLLSTENQ